VSYGGSTQRSLGVKTLKRVFSNKKSKIRSTSMFLHPCSVT